MSRLSKRIDWIKISKTCLHANEYHHSEIQFKQINILDEELYDNKS